MNDSLQAIRLAVQRFDHLLEMLVPGAAVVQQMYHGLVRDFASLSTANTVTDLPEGVGIVTFPLRPKPHEFPAAWVSTCWTDE